MVLNKLHGVTHSLNRAVFEHIYEEHKLRSRNSFMWLFWWCRHLKTQIKLCPLALCFEIMCMKPENFASDFKYNVLLAFRLQQRISVAAYRFYCILANYNIKYQFNFVHHSARTAELDFSGKVYTCSQFEQSVNSATPCIHTYIM